MVIDRHRETDESTDRRDRGQIILIGAIVVAFIILGIVVVFNGVLYTETLSTGSTSQSASGAATTEAEITHGISCLLGELDDPDSDEVKDEVDEFSELYQDAKGESRPEIVNIEPGDPENFGDDNAIVEVSYSSNDLDYTTTLEIEEANCP